MPLREFFSRTKSRIKKGVGVNSTNILSASSPNLLQPGQDPGSQSTQRSVTPGPHVGRSSPSATTLSPGNAVPPQPEGLVEPVASRTVLGPEIKPPCSQVPVVDPSVTPRHDANSTEMEIKTSPQNTESNVWPGLKALLKVVDSASDVFGPLKMAVSGLHQCLDVFEQASKGQKDYEELRNKLDSLLGDLGEHLDVRKNRTTTMTKTMANLSVAIHNEVLLIEAKSKRHTVRRHIQALDEAGEVMECYRRIEGNLERLALNANLSIWGTVNSLSEGLRDTRLQRISPSLSALYDSAQSSIVQRRKCTPGTRMPEIERLLTWAHNPGGKNVFWMNGMAGTGKTTIAYSVCAELDRQAALGASFFCSRLIPECRNVNLIIPAIAYQLAQFSYPFRCALSEVLETESDVHARVLERQFESLLVKPLLKVEDTLPKGFVVVIDALDECDDKQIVEHMLGLLLPEAAKSILPIRFLISSRPEPGIYSRMMERLGDALDSRLALHDLDAQQVKHDISIYLQEELAAVHLSPTQLAELVDRSGVLFIFASTAARYIKDGLRFQEHEDRLNTILGISNRLEGDQNHEIDQLYTTILKVALGGNRLSRSISERIKKTLDVVICAQEPMTVDTLARFLGMKSAMQADALLRPLCSVLNISESDGLVTTLHASFPDYMLDRDRALLHWCDPAAIHLWLAQACFSAICSSSQQFNIGQLESSYVADKDVEGLAERAKQAVSTELFYACRYWISHTEVHKGPGLDQPLFDFLSTRLPLWMEVLNLTKRMNLGPGIMRRAEIWSRVNSCETETTELAHDAWRFVSMFAGHAVSQSTAHIYVSMLPFWPEGAPVGRYYAKRINEANRAQGTATTRRQLTNLAAWTFEGVVIAASFSPDGLLIAYSAGSSVYLIDGSTGSAVLDPLRHDDEVLSVVFSPDGTLLASGSDDKTIRVWNTQSGKATVDPMTEHTGSVTSVCFTPGGAAIVSGSRDGTVWVWHWGNNRAVGPLEGHSGSVRSVCVSPDGTRIISGSDDNTIRLWDIESGNVMLQPMKGHYDWVRSVCFSPDGTRIISGSDDRTIRIWSAQTGQQLAEPCSGHTGFVLSVAFSPDGTQLVSGSNDKTIRLWNTDNTSEPAQLFEGHGGYVKSVAFSSDGARILSCSDDKTVRVWDARSKSVVDSPLEAHARGVSSVCFSPDGSRLLSASSDATVRVWDAYTGRALLGPLQGHSDLINGARFSPEGSLIAAGSANNAIQLWDSKTGIPASDPLSGHSGELYSVCFSPNGTLIASGSEDRTVRVWSTQTNDATDATLTGHTARVLSVCFSPDGNQIISGSGDRTIRVWDAITGQLTLGPLEGHTNEVWSVCFSPDGTRIASASRDKTIRLWDSSTGNTVCDPLEGHTGDVNSVCFTPDGEFIASGSDDRTIRLWDAHTGVAIGVLLTGHAQLIWSVSFSPDGSQIVSGSDDATIRVFDVSDLATLRSTASPTSPPDEDQVALTFACQPWMLQDDGWVVDAQSRLLAWVPLDLHTRLLRPRNTLLIAPMGSVKINLDHDKLGEGWTGSYKP